MKEEKFDWNDAGSIRVPTSVVKQLDEYKKKHGYTSRPQAIISAIERAEKTDLVEEIKELLKKISNEGKTDKKLTQKQVEWIIDVCLNDLNDFRNRCSTEEEVTINNHTEFNEDVFLDLPHSEYQMLISLLDTLK